MKKAAGFCRKSVMLICGIDHGVTLLAAYARRIRDGLVSRNTE